ncbi:MAG TPA: dihydrolipoamide acetyltransferase family protein [Clostridiales bacterium]|nr:dihydrolipoamide acetyltransferase family protein [Clostridiales bacterium]
MAVPVIMPRQGQSVESCIISKWYKKKGDQVKEGDILFTYETDKATFDEEAKIEGTILEIFFEEEDDVPILTNVCVIGQEGEDFSEFDPREKKEDASANASETDTSGAQTAGAGNGTAEGVKGTDNDKVSDYTGNTAVIAESKTAEGRIKISPRARNFAEKSGIDYSYANSTGPDGRIIERDIITLKEQGPVFTLAAKREALRAGVNAVTEGTGIGGRITTGDLSRGTQAEAGTNAQTAASGATASGTTLAGATGIVGASAGDEPESIEVKLTNIRKVIAKSMHLSLSSTAQLTLNASFDATEIMNYRKKIKENKDKLGLQNITLNDIVLYAVSRTLINHKNLNAYFLDDKMKIFNIVNLGVAIDTERGLMVPTVFHADKKSLNEISGEVKKLAEDCQKGTINPDLLTGGTFTVTNLGMMDIESFTPVLNPPQTGILGVNNIVQRAREVNGQFEYYPAMGLSLTFDHRAVDGAPAAKFLKELKANLENFSVLLAK